MLRTLIEKYALTFLRKTTILFHTSYSVDFPDVPEAYSDLPELSRLTTLLRLPNMNDLIDQITINNGANFTPQVVMGWLECYSVRQEQDYRDHVWLPHTGIPELIGLPEHYDVLLDECSKRRCPTTGKAINDPAICLFCGEIFCSQAFCCQRGELGGCSQHMPKCGGEIGLFIIIRKCIILFRHNRNGSFVTAPYLDEHGEPDRGLRHGRRLMLNQQRYDRLVRDAWLSHGVPSVISRRLDGDMNPGGWESL
ncbi:hypothetical protein KEM55_006289 [Ascosphaera atra]|nr:hypothetical protein KEM55_006289 [Ascosphaera atra]